MGASGENGIKSFIVGGKEDSFSVVEAGMTEILRIFILVVVSAYVHLLTLSDFCT